MNIATNPWTFVTADIPTPSTPTASPNGLVQQGGLGSGNLGAVLLTTTGAHNLSINQYITIIGTTGGRFVGWYKVIAVPTTTTALLANLSSPTSGQPFNTVLAGDGGGSVLVNQVQQNVRMEDISWQNVPVSATLILRDRNGLIIWQATSTLAQSNSQNRGKIMWVDGITLDTITTPSVVLATIN
jgi:hypothetical protein